VVVSPDLEMIRSSWNGVASYVLTIITTIFLCVLAYRFKLPRWYAYGVFFCLSFFLYRSVKSPFIISGFGGIVIIMGVIVLIDFLSKNPVPGSDEVEGNE
jgi:hypothetical protein